MTGATGFVGQHLLPALIQDGYEVLALSRNASLALAKSEIQWIQGDLREPQSWQAALKECSAILHLASVHEGSLSLIRSTNVAGTTNLVSQAQRAGISNIMYLSSVTATQNSKLPYSHSVWEAEQTLLKELPSVRIMRTTVIVGPGDPFLHNLAKIIKNWPFVPIFGDGSTLFQPIWIGDIARALLHTLSASMTGTKLITVGGASVLSLREIIEKTQIYLHLPKRIMNFPRKPSKRIVKLFHQIGYKTPFTSAYFLSKGLLAPDNDFSREFGIAPATFEQMLDATLRGESAHLT